VAGHLSLSAAVLPGYPEGHRRIEDLSALILTRTEEERGGPLVPDGFPVFVAHIDSVCAVRDNPGELVVTVDTRGMSHLPRGGVMAGVREICGAVASHMIEGPRAFPPEGPVGQPEPGEPQIPYWEKGRLQPGDPVPAPPLRLVPPPPSAPAA
jgi:hypothetical protein